MHNQIPNVQYNSDYATIALLESIFIGDVFLGGCFMKIKLFRMLSAVLALTILILAGFPGLSVQAEALSYSGSSSYKSGRYYTQLTQVSLTGDQRTDIVNIANSQVGYQEGSDSTQLSG